MKKLLGWRALALITLAPGWSTAAGAQSDSLLLRAARLAVADVSIGAALAELQAHSGVRLAFSPTLVPNRRVSCACTQVTVAQALSLMLQGTGLTFEERGGQIAVRGAADSRGPAVLRGTVLDGRTGEGIVDARVMLAAPARATISGYAGRFQLTGVPAGSRRITVRRIGYAPGSPTEISVASGDTLTLDLRIDPLPPRLPDLIVTPGQYRVGDRLGMATLRTLTRARLDGQPQLGEDAFRTAGALPGNAADDVSAKLRVRGGAPDELSVWFDGLKLIEPFHIKDFDGALGIIDEQAIDGADLLTGGFSARFGDGLAGAFVLYPRPSAGNRTAVGLSATNLSALSQGTSRNGKAGWLVSARRGYLDLVLELTGNDTDISPTYYDALGRFTYQAGANHLIAFNTLFARDVFFFSDGAFDIHSAWNNAYGWITWRGQLGARLRFENTSAIGAIDRSRSGGGAEPGRRFPESLSVDDRSDYRFASFGSHWVLDLSEAVSPYAGLSVQTGRATYDYLNWTETVAVDPAGSLVSIFDTVNIAARPSGREIGAYAGGRVRLVRPLVVDLGLRFDRHSHVGDDDLSPRAAVAWTPSQSTTLRASWGRYRQAQPLYALNVADGEAHFGPSESASQWAAGLEQRFASGVRLSLEGYRRSVEHPRSSHTNLSRDLEVFLETEPDRFLLRRTRSRARGLELQLGRDLPATSWSISYVLANTEDQIDGQWIARLFDQRHAATLTGSFHPAPGWRIGAAWRVHSGWPVSEPAVRADVLSDGSTVFSKRYDGINNVRLPIYHRLDVRVARTVALKSSRLNFYLDVFNAYNRKNPRSFDYDIDELRTPGGARLTRNTGQTLLPILPTLGVRWEW